MKVYIVTRTPFPNGMAPANRIKCYAKAILSQGIEVEVIIFARSERFGIEPRNKDGEGVFEGIPFRYIGKTPLRHRNVVVRAYFDYKDKNDCLDYLARNLKQDDIVIGYINEDVDFSIRLIHKVHHCRAKFIRELCELPYGTKEENKKSINNRQKVVKYQVPLCDGFICISQALEEFISPHMSKTSKTLIIPILVDFPKFELPDRSSESNYPYIFHAGTLTEQKDGVLGMLEAFGMASKDLPSDIKFILTGNINKAQASDQIKSVNSKYSMEDRVIFTGYLTDSELKEYLSKASLVIVNKYVTQQNKYCFSTKLGEYLAAAKPVIITKVGEATNWLKDGESAYIVPPGDKNQLANAIVESFTNTEKRKAIAENGKSLCKEKFHYLYWGKYMIDFFKELQEA